jgi:hypothetical protein
MGAATGIVTARVTTVAPLLHRGLVRAAMAAGFTIVAADSVAQVTLRVSERGANLGDAEANGEVDVVVGTGSVVLTVHRVPDVSTALKLRWLLMELLDTPTTKRRDGRSLIGDGGPGKL